MRRVLLFAVLTVSLWTVPVAVEAQALAACFDWRCEKTGQCTFDASCSTDEPLDFRWTFGDGTPTISIWDDPLAAHTYGESVYWSNVTLSVGYLFFGYYEVTCVVLVRDMIGPILEPYFSGTCS